MLHHRPALGLALIVPGHFVPISRRWRQFFIDYIKTGLANPGCVLSPSTSSESLDAMFAESNSVSPY